MKLSKTEQAAFAAIGKAITDAKDCAKDCAKTKKDNGRLVSAVIEQNRELFTGDGVTIGDYRFRLIVRDELVAIRV